MSVPVSYTQVIPSLSTVNTLPQVNIHFRPQACNCDLEEVGKCLIPFVGGLPPLRTCRESGPLIIKEEDSARQVSLYIDDHSVN